MVPPTQHGSVRRHFSSPRFQEPPPPPPLVATDAHHARHSVSSLSVGNSRLSPSFPLDWVAVIPGPWLRTPSAFADSLSAESPSYWLLESAATAAATETLTMMKSGVSPHFDRDLFLKDILASV